MVSERLSWQEWRSGGAALLLLRDYAPHVSEPVLAAAWRSYDQAETEQARKDVLVLLEGLEGAASAEGGHGVGMSPADLADIPVGNFAAELREQQEAWARRRELWDRIRRHEAQRRVHARLAEQHDVAAAMLLEEVKV